MTSTAPKKMKTNYVTIQKFANFTEHSESGHPTGDHISGSKAMFNASRL